jgi:hypothetical protein
MDNVTIRKTHHPRISLQNKLLHLLQRLPQRHKDLEDIAFSCTNQQHTSSHTAPTNSEQIPPANQHFPNVAQ